MRVYKCPCASFLQFHHGRSAKGRAGVTSGFFSSLVDAGLLWFCHSFSRSAIHVSWNDFFGADFVCTTRALYFVGSPLFDACFGLRLLCPVPPCA